jgi:shikimate kinase
VVLVGAPGAGKTSVGRLVAERLGTGFRDTDDDVVALAGKPVSDIFVDDGEAAFRELERGAVARAVDEWPGVLALGGGAVLDPRTRQLLRSVAASGCPVVHLAVSAGEAYKRVGMARDRPLLLGAPRAQLTALLRARAPLYAEVATVALDTDGKEPGEVAEEVLAVVAGRA